MRKTPFLKILIAFLFVFISSASVGAVTQDEENDDARMYFRDFVPLSDLTPKGVCLQFCMIEFDAPMRACIIRKRKEREESKKTSDQTTTSECKTELYTERAELLRCSRTCYSNP
jgi:hypothetical protein